VTTSLPVSNGRSPDDRPGRHWIQSAHLAAVNEASIQAGPLGRAALRPDRLVRPPTPRFGRSIAALQRERARGVLDADPVVGGEFLDPPVPTEATRPEHFSLPKAVFGS
jgi:hypothetical protein